MKKNVILLLGVCVIALAAIALLWWRTDLGVSREQIEQDARSGQQISDDWSVARDEGNFMVAMIFYDESRSDFAVSIYARQSEASDRYHNRFSGSTGMTATGIVEYAFDDCEEQALLSMNEQKAVQAVLRRGEQVENRELNGDKPFSLVLDSDVTEVVFYDANGNVAGDYKMFTE